MFSVDKLNYDFFNNTFHFMMNAIYITIFAKLQIILSVLDHQNYM